MQCSYGKIARIIENGIGINAEEYVKKIDGIPSINACLVN